MKSMPIGRKKFVTCLEEEELKNQTQIRMELEKNKDQFLKKRIKEDQERMKRWQEEVDDDVAPI
jgi:hypothetical protein